MSKVEQLRKCLQAARKNLNAKGYKYIPGESKLMDCKPFEIAYQDCIEKIWPEEPWWKVTNYWDIFDAMMGGLSDEEVIDEIINHVAPEYLKEGVEKAKVEDGHSYEEYMKKFGRAYNDGELWDFSEEDFKGGAIEVNPGITYWKIEVEGEPRYFETSLEEALHHEKKSLDEGTSNFPTRFPHDFPLLVFYTIEEVYDRMDYDSDKPEESDFEDEDGNVDEDAYWDAVEKFEQEYFDKIDCCVLDESQVDELEDKLYDFNQETKNIAYEADVVNGEQQYGDKLNLEDVELKIEAGYYEAAYIDVDHEEYLDGIEEGEWKDAQIKRIKDFMLSLKEEFGLSQYVVGWGPASNGETGYKKVENLKEDGEEWECQHCHKHFPATDEGGRVETDMGFLCHGCIKDLEGKGEKLHFEDEVKENMYDGKKGGNKGSVKTKVHVNKNAGNPKRNMEIFNHMMDVGTPKSGTTVGMASVSLGEEVEEVAREEYCLMSGGNNIDCYDSKEEAIESAKEYAEELKNRGIEREVYVLLVKYGPKDEHGDEPELGTEGVWSNGIEESLKEGKLNEVADWQKDPKEVAKIIKDWKNDGRADLTDDKIRKILIEYGTEESVIDKAFELADFDSVEGNIFADEEPKKDTPKAEEPKEEPKSSEVDVDSAIKSLNDFKSKVLSGDRSKLHYAIVFVSGDTKDKVVSSLKSKFGPFIIENFNSMNPMDLKNALSKKSLAILIWDVDVPFKGASTSWKNGAELKLNLSGKEVSESLKEDIDEYDPDFKECCEDVARGLEAGWWHGMTRSERSWGLEVNGGDGNQFSPAFADVISYECSYPVREGNFSMGDLDCNIQKSSFPEHIDFSNESDREMIKTDLKNVGCSEEDIEKFFNDEISEIEFFISYDIDIDDLDEGEEDEIDLPKEVTMDAQTMNDLGINPSETEGDELDELIGDWLSDEYGFCHYGFEYDVEGDHINIYNIEWDTSESLKEDTVKQNGKWVNKGKEGTHGEFKTKKAADAQRKAMFANGYKEELVNENKHDDGIKPQPDPLDVEEVYLSDKVTQVLDDYGILYGDVVENGDGTVNIVGVDESEWDEVVEAIESELGLSVLVPDPDHGEFDDELIVREALEEASSAEKKAYRDGGKAFDDLVQGKAIARIKDPEMRQAAVTLAKSGNSKGLKRFVGDRKETQATQAFMKKQQVMKDAGLTESEGLKGKIISVIKNYLKKHGYEDSDIEWFVVEEKPYEDGEGHKANHVQIRNELVGFYEADELIKELDEIVEPGYFEPYDAYVWDAYAWEQTEEDKARYAEFKKWLNKGE